VSSTPDEHVGSAGTGGADAAGSAGTAGRAPAAGPPTGEAALLAELQNVLRAVPGSMGIATALSHTGEHAIGWVALSAFGAWLQPERRTAWVTAGAGAFGAHAASVVVKRIVRRKRPHHPAIRVGVGTPSKMSFPSSHATSTTAFALLAGEATGNPRAKVLIPATLIPAMLASRLTLGVHYPSDVMGGAALGAASAVASRRLAPEFLSRAGAMGLLPAALVTDRGPR